MFVVLSDASAGVDSLWKKQLADFLLTLDLGENQRQKLETYLERVRDAGVSLVSRRDRDRLIERHLKPSLEALPFLPKQGWILDVGSGGGFPAIPLAIARPNLQVVLVESVARKAAFLTRVSRETSLNNVEILNRRVETLADTHFSDFDAVTARSVAKLPTIIRWTESLLKQEGCWILWKGSGWTRELDLQEKGLELTKEKPLDDGSTLLVIRRTQRG